MNGQAGFLPTRQGAPRDPRRHSRGERSPWLPLETRPNSPGVRTESEMERKPEVPASTQDEAFSIAAKPEESRA